MQLSSSTVTLIWFAVFLILFGIELITMGLTTIWFAIGALAVMALNLFGVDHIVIQLAVFLSLSCLLLIFTRKWAIRHFNPKVTLTNYEEYIGETVLITEKVDNLAQTGKGTVKGQEWTVRSKEDSQVIESGRLAKVIRIEGVKLIVEKIKEDTLSW
ncbi:NfeD family protein [Ruminococcus sp. CLA-AA-H200]|uniref:NfeD family protein n=1 Tax=Ruminococcus turbiniformis TaxID=2881258 RepID=A0ABS8FX58_9FIRM|nr:NfeD family protein [Ruminococcus turbiniformis]MCC2254551.1 NfeD family protein [Ruminococcus turbiniformis]